jgi:hypothetical protein
MKKKLLARLSGLGLALFAVGVLAAAAHAAGPHLCPAIYAPVICSNGKVYPNQCYADKAHAKDCVPYGAGL